MESVSFNEVRRESEESQVHTLHGQLGGDINLKAEAKGGERSGLLASHFRHFLLCLEGGQGGGRIRLDIISPFILLLDLHNKFHGRVFGDGHSAVCCSRNSLVKLL